MLVAFFLSVIQLTTIFPLFFQNYLLTNTKCKFHPVYIVRIMCSDSISSQIFVSHICFVQLPFLASSIAILLILLLLTKGVTSSITKRRESRESETKPKPKTRGGGGGLFDGDDEDDLFSGTTSKPSPTPAAQGMSFVLKCQYTTVQTLQMVWTQEYQ